MNGMVDTRVLGHTGEEVSIICIGGWDVAARGDEKESISMLHEAIDHGATFMDNCWDYIQGKAEEVMGKALKGPWREKAFLMTKACGRTYDDAMSHLEDSLRRLQTDRIDLWQFHGIKRFSDPEIIWDGALKAALDAKRDGKVRYIGFTGHASPRFHLKMLELDFAWDTVQMPISLLDAQYDSFEKQVLPVLNERNIGVLGMKSLAAQEGRLVREVGVSANICRRYALSRPITSLVIGVQTPDELRQDLAIATDFVPPTAEEINAALERAAPFAADGHIEDYKVGDWGCNFHYQKAGD